MATIAIPATAANAAVRSGSATYALPPQPPSLNPQPPVADQRPIVHVVSVSYDDQTGMVSLSMSLYDPGYWANQWPGQQGAPVTVDIDNDCGAKGTVLTVTLAPSNTSASGTAGMTGYPDQLQTTGTFDGQTYNVTFQHPAFAGHDFRCVSPSQNGSPINNGPSSFYFNGYVPISLTASLKRTAATAWLTSKYGAVWTRSARQYLLCPSADIMNNLGDCWAEFGTGRAWHFANITVQITNNKPVVTFNYRRSWTRRWRTSPRSCLRSLPGHLSSNDGACDVQIAGDVQYAAHVHPFAVGVRGTGTGYFKLLAIYYCHRQGRTTQCTNAAGDSFRYTP